MSQPIAVVVAMQSELNHLIPPENLSFPLSFGPWNETHTIIGDTPVIAIRCGIGMVAAAAATEYMLGRYSPSAILNFGCSGSHIRNQHLGDVVIGTGLVAHAPVRVDPDGTEIFTVGGFGVGEDAESPNFFVCDRELVRLAEYASAGWTPEPWPSPEPRRIPVVCCGNVGSGDVWNQHNVRLDRLNARHGTLCEDMEAAAIAQIAAFHGVPFLSIKDISNNEFHAVTNFDQHGAGIIEAELGKRAGKLTWRVIELLVANAGS